MGADNWAICPKCQELAEDRRETLEDKVNRSYGQVSPEEYLALVKKLDQPIVKAATLREDYEIGISSNGEFYVRYRASCKTCGFDYGYKYDKRIDL